MSINTLKTNKFIHDNFLLENKYAEELYHSYASKMPIIDYHCHLPPRDIAEDTVFKNLTEVWIYGDHYKWRAMRALGVDEKYITGNASDEDKFKQWAKTVPYTMRNPLYHWTHLELARYFDIHELLNENSASAIYEEAKYKLNETSYSCQNLLTNMNVEVVCTTEDPTETLKYHQKLKDSKFKTKVSTAFRPDKAILIEKEDYNSYIYTLAEVSGIEINTYTDLCEALRNRIAYFDSNGCKLSDHGLDYIFYESFTVSEVNMIFKKKKRVQD